MVVVGDERWGRDVAIIGREVQAAKKKKKKKNLLIIFILIVWRSFVV